MSIYANQNDALSSEIQTTTESVELLTAATIDAEEPINTTPAYVYRLFCKPTGQFYYGVRYANIKKYRIPEDDLWIHYFASSDSVDALVEKYGKSSFDYKVIFQSTDIDQTYWFEQTIIKAYRGNPKLLNLHYVDQESGHRKWVITEEATKKAKATGRARGSYKASGERRKADGSAKRAAQKAAITKKSKGIDKIATQKMVETRQSDGSYITGAQKAAATRKATGADKVATIKRIAKMKATGSAKRGARKAVETKRKKGTLQSNAQKAAATRKIKGLDKIINEKAVATKKAKGIYAQSGKKAAATRKATGLDKIINEKAVATKQANGTYHKSGIKAAETRTKRGKDAVHSQYWQLTKPDGEVFIIQNLEKFCRENNMSRSSMGAVAYGKKTHHRGWKCEKLVKQFPLPANFTDKLKDN